MNRRLQLGKRENPASNGRHGSRLVVRSEKVSECAKEADHEQLSLAVTNEGCITTSPNGAHCAVTGRRSGECSLLTVHEVSELLQVPVSWVYGRIRKRATERLPGFRLGKYWRFSEREVLAWVATQRGGRNAS